MASDGEWHPTKPENPSFVCRQCKSGDVEYRIWNSSCGGYVDVNYHCKGCDRHWWWEGADA